MKPGFFGRLFGNRGRISHKAGWRLGAHEYSGTLKGDRIFMSVSIYLLSDGRICMDPDPGIGMHYVPVFSKVWRPGGSIGCFHAGIVSSGLQRLRYSLESMPAKTKDTFS